jgi:hypothetical protein
METDTMPEHNEAVNKRIKGRFLFCFLLTLAYLFPLLTSGHYYADDLLHSVTGQTPWNSNGRPLSNGLFHLLMAGGLLSDIAPLTQILGAATISASIIFLSFRISKSGVILPVLALFPIISSPYYLENWSFRYDSLTMAFAVSAAILPYAFKSDDIVKSIASSTFCLFISLCFYQAALNLFISFAAIIFIVDTYEKRCAGKYKELAGRVAGLLLANAIYTLTIKKFIVTGDYNIIHSELASGSLTDILSVIVINYASLSSMFFSAFAGSLRNYFLIPIIFSMGFIFLVLKHIFLNQQIKALKMLDLAILMASIIVIYASIFGPLLLLKSPVFSPRVLIGASGIMVFITLSVAILTENIRALRWIIALPVIGMFVLAYSYYNAQRTTDELEATMISEIKTTIALQGGEGKGIAFKGSAPHSAQSKLAEWNFPIIGRIIFNDLNQDFLWGRLRLEAFGLQIPYVSLAEATQDLCGMKLVGDFGGYYMRSGSGYFVVDYDRNECKF